MKFILTKSPWTFFLYQKNRNGRMIACIGLSACVSIKRKILLYDEPIYDGPTQGEVVIKTFSAGSVEKAQAIASITMSMIS